MKYAWIARHKNHWPVSLACDLLGVSTSGFFESIRRQGAEQPSRPGANKRISSEALLAHIRAIHAEVKQEYGWPIKVNLTFKVISQNTIVQGYF